jgi:ribonuclease P protein component
LGLIVPRHGATAVARNQLRRRLREIARRSLLPRLPTIDLVVRSRAEAYRAGRRELQADLEQWQCSLAS